jgi:hypothetical protein
MYLPPPNQTLLASPVQWGSDIITEMQACILALFDELGSASSGTTEMNGQVVVSYKSGNVVRDDPLVEPVTGMVVNPVVATQRRRLRSASY